MHLKIIQVYLATINNINMSKSNILNIALAVFTVFSLVLVGVTDYCRGNDNKDKTFQENLFRTCLVWGFVKYTHPSFISGSQNWDEHLIHLLQRLDKNDSNQDNIDLLTNWVSELDFKDWNTSVYELNYTESEVENHIQTASVSWKTDENFLGSELFNSLKQLGEVPLVDRRKGPVFFTNGLIMPDFSNEPEYPNMDYSDQTMRLLGLFRFWNAIEYYYPYLNLIDTNWHDNLKEAINDILQGDDELSYFLTLAKLSAKLQDAHVNLINLPNNDWAVRQFGSYSIPVSLIKTSEGIAVWKTLDSQCELEPGDIILEINGTKTIERVKYLSGYFAITDESKYINRLGALLFATDEEYLPLRIQREGKTISIDVKTSNYIPEQFSVQAKSSIEWFNEGRICLIHPSRLTVAEARKVLRDAANASGIIIDFREYPCEDIEQILADYLINGQKYYARIYQPSVSRPGLFIRNKVGVFINNENKNHSLYTGKVVVLIDEHTQSAAETMVLILKQCENAIIIGDNSIGTDGNVNSIILPGNVVMTFTGIGYEYPDGLQLQRVGIIPDIKVLNSIEALKRGEDDLIDQAIELILSEQE